MKPKFIFGGDNCAGGSCPTVYQGDDGSYYVQGYIVADNVEISLPSGETVVQLPQDFLESFIKEQSQKFEK